MVIAGAGGHATEIFDILKRSEFNADIIFFDEINFQINYLFEFPVIHSIDELERAIAADNRFCLGTGNPSIRKKMFNLFESLNATATSIISPDAIVSIFNTKLEKGLNIMNYSLVSPNVTIGNGTLINAGAYIHHDSTIGEFCEISPGVHISGNCTIGNYTTIGTNAILLPKLTIGSNVTIGAGAVVTSNIPNNCLVVGVPAKKIKELEPFNNHID